MEQTTHPLKSQIPLLVKTLLAEGPKKPWEESTDQFANNSAIPPPGLQTSSDSSFDRDLNFSTVGNLEETDFGFSKRHKTMRDPLSHRIIEKRRRDRMNNCLADLARLLPQASLRKGRGRIEKTEIIELAIKHIQHLRCHSCQVPDICPLGLNDKMSHSNERISAQESDKEEMKIHSSPNSSSSLIELFRLGFQECISETMHFLVEIEGMFAGDPLCVRLIQHLNQHRQNVPLVLGEKRITHESFSSGMFGGSKSLDEGEGDNNSCSSTPLSIEILDVQSQTTGGAFSNVSSSKPPVPSYIRGTTSSTSESPPVQIKQESDETQHSQPSLYKFKSKIKERFTEDSLVQLEGDALKKTENTSSIPHCSTQSPNEKKINKVPGFALNEKGGFYIPITIEKSTLVPYLPKESNEDSNPLHPVTISVLFLQPPTDRVLSPVQFSPKRSHEIEPEISSTIHPPSSHLFLEKYNKDQKMNSRNSNGSVYSPPSSSNDLSSSTLSLQPIHPGDAFNYNNINMISNCVAKYPVPGPRIQKKLGRKRNLSPAYSGTRVQVGKMMMRNEYQWEDSQGFYLSPQSKFHLPNNIKQPMLGCMMSGEDENRKRSEHKSSFN